MTGRSEVVGEAVGAEDDEHRGDFMNFEVQRAKCKVSQTCSCFDL
jgi:hypothetical protein